MDINCPTVIPYYGGKFEISKKLVRHLPDHLRYFEPFFGGGSMYFRKNKVDWNILNDVDNDLVNLYICVIDKFNELANRIYWYPRSRKLHDDFRSVIKSTQYIDIPDVERASQYYYIVRNAFNSKPLNTFSKDSYWNTRMVEELKMSKKKLDGATIENLDFEELIERYSIRDGDFIYLDPPYVIADKKDYYRNRFDSDMHNRLKNVIEHISDNGGKFMLSYDNKPEVRDMYSEYNITTIKTKYVGRRSDPSKEFKELIITNFKMNNTQMEMFNGA